MIIEQIGNILNSTCDLIVIPVNTMGVMGKGLAKEFKDRYLLQASMYEKQCKYTKREGGDVFRAIPEYKFLFFCTKEHWKNPSKIEWIELGLYYLMDSLTPIILPAKPLSIAIPPLGCGLGGLNWDDVYPLIQKYLGNIEGLTVHVYLPRNDKN